MATSYTGPARASSEGESFPDAQMAASGSEEYSGNAALGDTNRVSGDAHPCALLSCRASGGDN